ncbi:PilX N-terminal domain-containing pilus assembly protein [Pseudomonas sp. D(2018)]|uniref:PilX N-terminal domain-containing pilus assembly protein n=1 Tax=Pseudomonas sp. D(2018) TaxID=2502238 RepID=UPI0010F71E2B|nr:PilX N-terminal domain-containing pilus assembly protein [Pseudomonas sp. D(2018)]
MPMTRYTAQRGVALVVSLVLLLLLTLLAIAASNTSSLQERMALNSQENNVAFQTAESGIADAVDKLDREVTPATDSLYQLTYDNPDPTPDRTARTRVQVIGSEEFGNSICVNNCPVFINYDITSSATLDPNVAAAADIDDDNTNARHLRGYRDREIR